MRIKEFRALARRWKFAFKKYFNAQKFPNVEDGASLGLNDVVVNPLNLYMEGNSSLKRDDVIMNARARFVLKKWSGAAEELMVITGNHMSIVGKNVKDISNEVKYVEDIYNEFDKDVIVEEDVWMGARVTLLQGITIGRGAEIGAGTVVRSSVPPYAIVIGNPAKVIGFRFTPQEIIEHEMALYTEDERLPLELLEKNYKKYFKDHYKEIRSYLSLICK